MQIVLEIDGISKRYGKVQALKPYKLQIPKGTTFGILGPNGSGKTTTLGIILGILSSDSGGFTWFDGQSVNTAKKRIGALLETPNFYPYMTAYQNLKLVAKIKELQNPNIDAVLKTVNLHERAHHKFKGYSLGMKQRLAIAASLLGEPEVLLLDEPTNGLDPTGIAEVRDLITRIAANGTTVIIASHILAEVEKVCSHVAVLQNGSLLYSGLADELSAKDAVIAVASADMQALEIAIKDLSSLKKLRPMDGHLHLSFSEDMSPSKLNQLLAEQGIYLSYIEEKKASLEERFLKILTRDKAN
ncbi:MAG: ABC transporter ATP-binding protein [Bacteroidetes bacterium]|nr:MAG: ABC transporter ATP-binding protein [Bacteroidota bacterium]